MMIAQINKRKGYNYFVFVLVQFAFVLVANAQLKTKLIPVGLGWANNSINTVVFRKNSLCTFKNTQYIAYYNKDGLVVLGKRKLKRKKWLLQITRLKANVNDAHNSISIMVDGDGYLHIAWDHHNNKLHYCKSITPGSLQLTNELPMTTKYETKVSYPEFYKTTRGNLFFLYRDGGSGKGNLIVNFYDIKLKLWKQLHSNLIDGENTRNAYWQAVADNLGNLHISWVWRETPDVASNHDMCYAKSTDGGITWQKSNGEIYKLPINASTAEYIIGIPQKSELINQTSMAATENGFPIIATYFKAAKDSCPQYYIISYNGKYWNTYNTGFRKTNFSLSGAGTKRIPISRPQIITYKNKVALIFREEELGSKVSIALCKNLNENNWKIVTAFNSYVGSWEPTYDTELWRQKNKLNLFVQHTEQADGEGKNNIEPTMVNVLKVKLK